MKSIDFIFDYIEKFYSSLRKITLKLRELVFKFLKMFKKEKKE